MNNYTLLIESDSPDGKTASGKINVQGTSFDDAVERFLDSVRVLSAEQYELKIGDRRNSFKSLGTKFYG